jgi:hypothetical protein
VKPVASSVPKKLCPKAKDSWVLRRVKKVRRELAEPWTLGADFYCPAQDINLPYRMQCLGVNRGVRNR